MPPFAFFGTPYAARDTLAALVAAGFRPSVVITSPAAQKGRGLQLVPSETETYARELGIPVLTPASLDQEFLADLLPYSCVFGVVVAYGKLLPRAVIDAFPHGLYNIHYSLLPKYRGASPVESALRADEHETGVTLQKLVLAMDAGDIVAQSRENIDVTDTTRTLRPRLITRGSALLIEYMPALASGAPSVTPQDSSAATRAPKIAKAEGELRLSGDSHANWLTYRALDESPGTFFYATKGTERMRIKIAKAQYRDGRFEVTRIIPEGKPERDFTWLAETGWTPD